jgi:HK97 family phage portal protein
MGLLDFFKSEKRSHNSSTVMQSSYGIQANSGVAVDENSALNFSAVWACVRVISEAVASLPIGVFKEDENGNRGVDKSSPIYSLLAYEPNSYMTSFIWRECLMNNLLIHGNSYFLIKRDSSLRPIELCYLNPEDVNPVKVDDVIYYNVEEYDSPIPQYDMLHFVGMGYDGIKGKSVLRVHADTIGLSLGANVTATSYFGNSTQVAGVLKHPGKLSEEAASRLKASWNNNYSGPYNSNRTAILEEGLDFKAISIPASDRQLLDSRLFQVQEIARIFRVPPHLIGDLSKASYNSMEQLSIEFVRTTLRPYLVNIESELNRKLFRESERGTYYTKMSVEGLLRGDSQARANFYREMLQTGVFSINEVRRFEDMNPIENGDEHLVPLNFQPLNNINLDSE